MNLNKLFWHTFIFSLFSIPLLVLAQPVGLENPIGVDSISGLITIVVKVIRYIAIPFVVIAIMWAGWLYIYGGATGNEKSVEEASKALRWTVIGAFVILSAEMIAIVIENTLKSLN